MTEPAVPAPPAPAGGVPHTRPRRTGRNAELGLLLLAMTVVTAYAAAVEMNELETVTGDFWVPVGVLAGIFLAAHIAVRVLAPYADPVLLPAVAMLNGFGVLFLRRIDLAPGVPTGPGQPAESVTADVPAFSGFGGRQLIWTLIAVTGAVVLLRVVRDHRTISRYAWTLGLVGLVLMVVPGLLPSRFSEVNGAKLWILIGPFSIQPGEFAKLALLSFFAYYLFRKREVLSLAGKRIVGIDFPRGRDLGPVVVVWLLSVMVLVFQRDLGMSLLYLGMFVVTLYVATERASWLIIGLLLFSGGAFLAYTLGATLGGPFANFALRVDVWLDPFADPYDQGYQPVQALLALGTGGLFGAGPGAGQFCEVPPGVPCRLPEVHNDFVFAGLGEEIGLFGLAALLVLYLVIVTRGVRAGLAVRDSFGKLLAGGLAFTLGLQVFVIIGGVTGLIPLTGQTTPFLSAGGSSLVANWLLVGVLLRISDAARRPAVPPPVAVPAVGAPPPAPVSPSPGLARGVA